MKRLLCRLGLHKLDVWYPYGGRVIKHGRCRRCGKTGLVDSQGGLF